MREYSVVRFSICELCQLLCCVWWSDLRTCCKSQLLCICCSNHMNDFERQEVFIREVLVPVREFWMSDICRE